MDLPTDSGLQIAVSATQKPGPTIEVQAVTKGTAILPCDIVPPIANDSAILVIWYKNDMTAIYSYDARGKHSDKASHWKEKELVDERAYFRTITEPATLSVDSVEERDEGEYRCRVDFRKSPTRNTKVRLTVIVPPQKPNIIDDRGKEVVGVAGPYEEGAEMKLTCIVSGGRPSPSVRWWRGDAMVDSTDTQSPFPHVMRNQLVVARLERTDLHATYTCQASNNNISQPVSASVTVEMHFKPLSATILNKNQGLSADRKYEIVCQAVGSRPPAKITWWKDNKRLESFVEKVSTDGNVTTSTTTLTPSMQDNGRTLTCRADNPRVQGGAEEDTWKMDVYYVPVVRLELGSNLNPKDIEEGDDVYFECNVDANPHAYKVVWKHNNQVIQHNQKLGVITTNQDLALQAVNRHHAGNYSCIASNIEGDGDSNTVELRVMYKPICRSEQKRVYGVARHENANVVCEVEAFPAPDSFKWSFNNTAETIDVPQARYQTGAFFSTLTYTPVTEMDYGTVVCWAANTAGQQREPCVFQIIAAGKPEVPLNCSIVNQTTDGVEVECIEGFDGGQPQFFLLEVRDAQSGLLRANLSSKFPAFAVSGLEPGRGLKMAVFAANAKGRSEPALVEGHTLKPAQMQTRSPIALEMGPVLGILVGMVAALLLVTLAIFAAMRCRGTGSTSVRARGRQGENGLRPGTAGACELLTATAKEKVALPLRSNVEDLYEMDDKNPDVIPCNKDSDYQLVSGSQGLAIKELTEVSYDGIAQRNNTSRNGDLYENYKNSRYPTSRDVVAEWVV
ncbi:hemicentin-1 isoform X2 [Ischnura elegans]|uniref:hemicentin-1 isoform X2 n=1 Tax=Ischnura elegans TaxID=197161 RepID=UPI001ED8716D|nr:hemicentin-1 isoform X2 [Ischnura elegans]